MSAVLNDIAQQRIHELETEPHAKDKRLGEVERQRDLLYSENDKLRDEIEALRDEIKGLQMQLVPLQDEP